MSDQRHDAVPDDAVTNKDVVQDRRRFIRGAALAIAGGVAVTQQGCGLLPMPNGTTPGRLPLNTNVASLGIFSSEEIAALSDNIRQLTKRDLFNLRELQRANPDTSPQELLQQYSEEEEHIQTLTLDDFHTLEEAKLSARTRAHATGQNMRQLDTVVAGDVSCCCTCTPCCSCCGVSVTAPVRTL